MLREHPWNLRRVGHRHLHDHRNLIDLHFLTHAWLPGAADGVRNPFSANPSLEDDTTPEDVLLRLEQDVYSIQFETLKNRFTERLSLNELSWQAGRECCLRRWPDYEHPIRPDKRALLMALHHSPLAGRHSADAFLMRRALNDEVSIELRNCPHSWADQKRSFSKSIPDPLLVDTWCEQQFHWLRGYFNPLNPAVNPVHSRSEGRCQVSW